MLSAHFEIKQSMDSVALPSTCHLSPSLTTIDYGSREVRRLWLDLDFSGGAEPLGMFNIFLKRTTHVLLLGVGMVFRRLLCLDSLFAED